MILRALPVVFLLATLARAETVSGTVSASGGLVSGEARLTLAHGALSETLRGFVGESVRVEGETRRGRFYVSRILSPVREEVSAIARWTAAGWRLDVADGRRLVACGNTGVLQANGEVMTDLWAFEGGRAHVVAVEGATTRDWTLLKRRVLGGYTVYSAVIRGLDRPVWVLRREGDAFYVRRGDKEGWVSATDLAVWTPRAGLVGRLSRE